MTIAAGPADYQLALDALPDGVILWSRDGRIVVANAAVTRMMGLPDALSAPGTRRVDVMIYLARRGDYGPADDPESMARDLSDRFAAGAVPSLTRRLPDGRHVRAESRLLDDGRLLVTYREVAGPDL